MLTSDWTPIATPSAPSPTANEPVRTVRMGGRMTRYMWLMKCEPLTSATTSPDSPLTSSGTIYRDGGRPE